MITTTDELAKIVDDVAADSTVFMYMPFTKFTGLLVSGGLWFGAQSNQIDVREPEPLLPSLSIGQHLEPSIHVRRYLAAMTCVGCWTLDDVLSDTMWRAYASTNGIAIQSTVRRLKQCFGSLDRASFGPVVYADGQQGMKDRRFRRELEYRGGLQAKTIRQRKSYRM